MPKRRVSALLNYETERKLSDCFLRRAAECRLQGGDRSAQRGENGVEQQASGRCHEADSKNGGRHSLRARCTILRTGRRGGKKTQRRGEREALFAPKPRYSGLFLHAIRGVCLCTSCRQRTARAADRQKCRHAGIWELCCPVGAPLSQPRHGFALFSHQRKVERSSALCEDDARSAQCTNFRTAGTADFVRSRNAKRRGLSLRRLCFRTI